MKKNYVKGEPESSKELDEIARKLLLAAGVGDKLPTPQTDIIQCAKLVQGGEIDLDEYKESFGKKVNNILFSGWNKIKGLLAVGDRTIYISSDVPSSQRPFINFHEVGHEVIPWQRDTYKLFADDNYCLSPKIEEQYEKEANYFSAKLLFQCERLTKQAKDYELSINTGIKFAQDYGCSYHSTLWEYVSTHSEKCILLVLKKSKNSVLYGEQVENPYELLYSVPSKSFSNEFGEQNWGGYYYSDHPFTQAINCKKDQIYEGGIKINNINNDSIELKFQTWTNQYNIFILIYMNARSFIPKRKVSFF